MPIFGSQSSLSARGYGAFFNIEKEYVITPSSTGLSEGQTVVFTINTTGVTNGTVLYWNIGSGTVNSADFTTAISGTTTVSGGQAFVQLTTRADVSQNFEGTESFQLFIRTESQSGPVVAISSLIYIFDTSAFNQTGDVYHVFNNQPGNKFNIALNSSGAVTNVQTQNINSPDLTPEGNINAKHYIITMNANYSSLSFTLLSCYTAAGGAYDCGQQVSVHYPIGSNQWRVWWVRGNGASDSFVRNWRVTGTF